MKFNIFELGIFSFSSYVYYLTRGFIASTRAFNLATRAFSLLTRGFELVTLGFELVSRVLLSHRPVAYKVIAHQKTKVCYKLIIDCLICPFF